jgi:hypothetical protein
MSLQQLLSSPLGQTALVPFGLSLLIGLLLVWLIPRWTGLALACGFYGAAQLIESGLRLGTSAAVSKLLLIGLLAVLLGLLLDLRPQRGAASRAGVAAIALPLALLAAAAGLWVLWPVLGRFAGSTWLWVALGIALYPAWLVGWVCALSVSGRAVSQHRAAVLATLLPLATGVCALLAASARIAQLSLALGLAMLALLLVTGLRPTGRLQLVALLPASLLAALLGLAAAGLAWPPFARMGPGVLLALAALAPLAALPFPGVSRAGPPLAETRWQVLVIRLLVLAWSLPALAAALWLIASASPASGSGYG